MIIGGCVGYVLGRLMVFAINKVPLDTEGLYPVFDPGMIFFTFAVTDISEVMDFWQFTFLRWY